MNLRNSSYISLLAGTVALVPAAHAGTVTVPVNEDVTYSGTASYDLTSSGGPDLTFSTLSMGPAVADADVTGASDASYAVDGSGDPLASSAGATISSANLFGSSAGVLAGGKFEVGCVSGNFPCDGSTQYLGFEFTPGAGGTDYGYVALSVFATPLSAPTIEVQSFTYDDSGASVTIPGSATPEPGSFTLLAAGAAGIAALRARRKSLL
jgi:hypothetical protein